MQFPANRQGPTSDLEIMRGDVVQILHDATKDLPRVKYLFGLYVESFTQEGDHQTGGGPVNVCFSNGTEGAYDLLVGADGINSRTRRLMLAPADDSKNLHQLGVHVAFYSISARPDDSYDCVACQMGNGLLLLTRHDRKDVLRVLIMARGEFPEIDEVYRLGDVRKIKQAWASQLEGVGWQGKRFQDGLLNETVSDDIYAQRMAQVKLPEGKWSKGRVVLIGDAAACAPLGGGLGSTISLTTAYVLAGEIAKHCFKTPGVVDTDDIGLATKEYERKMRPFIKEAQDTASPGSITAMMPDSRLEVWFWRLVVIVLSLLIRLKLDVLFRSLIVTSEAEKWVLPFYPELEAE
jgi:2-polyprenyl-6-methoxyphenol hydroxylase-like FAD-dependent oxidoreductase